MPIVTDEKGVVRIEYSLPKELKDLIDVGFSRTMISELKKVFKYLKNENEIIGVLYMNAGTSGVQEAFKNTCNILGLKSFLEASKLDWFDYDLFMDEVLTTTGEMFYGKEEYKKLCNKFVDSWE